MMKTAIIIPARYGSTRFPGKPLAKINGKEMLLHVYGKALEAKESLTEQELTILVATEDERIAQFCADHDIACAMTSEDCASGTDRAKEAIETLKEQPDFIVNLQGDLIIPSSFVQALIADFTTNPDTDILTPVLQLSWDQLDQMREDKQSTPFSGTTVTMTPNRHAYWFSKNIIPAIRKEEQLRNEDELSPIYRHLGMYGYALDALKKYVTLPESTYEKIEGLEQLRALENGMRIRCVPVSYGDHPVLPGIDSPEDLKRTEALL